MEYSFYSFIWTTVDWISHPGNSLNLIINGWGDCSQPCPRMAKGKMVDLVLSHISGMGGFFCFFVFFPHLRFSVFFLSWVST